MNLAEPLVTAMVTLLKRNLNAAIDTLNATITDGFTVPHAAQIVPYIPVPSTIAGGTPIIGVQEFPADFEDDLQFDLDAEYTYGVVAILQEADQQTLVWQLRRMMQAIANTVQADRVATVSVMRSQGGAWAVRFIRTEPGPVLGDLDINSPDAPPRSYLSWCALVLSSKRKEVNG